MDVPSLSADLKNNSASTKCYFAISYLLAPSLITLLISLNLPNLYNQIKFHECPCSHHHHLAAPFHSGYKFWNYESCDKGVSLPEQPGTYHTSESCTTTKVLHLLKMQVHAVVT